MTKKPYKFPWYRKVYYRVRNWFLYLPTVFGFFARKATGKKITVVEWIDYDEAVEKYKESIGGMGGFFKDGMRGQKDYFDNIGISVRDYYDALRKEIIAKKIKCGGDRHQQDMTPLFSDGTYASFSYRAWGDLMAAIWSEEENKDYGYMDFYMEVLLPKEEKVAA